MTEHLTEPLAVPMREAQRITGFSRSDIYRRAGRGEIIFYKSGRTTLVDMQSLRRAVARLPRATIRPAKHAA